MKKSVIALILIAALLSAGCGSTSVQPTVTPAQTEIPAAAETPDQTDNSDQGEGLADENSEALQPGPYASYAVNQATVVEIGDEMIQTTTDVNAADDFENTINFVPTQDTLVYDSQGNKLSLSDLKKGDLITVYTGIYTPTPMIMPPQFQAEIIIIENASAEKPCFTWADTFIMDGEGMLTGAGETLTLTIDDSVNVVDRDDAETKVALENMDLLVFYDSSTRSIPAQTTPLKVVVLGSNEQALENINAQ